MHQSFGDRGADGGLAGSDVRVLNTSHRQCTVIGINNQEIPGLDIDRIPSTNPGAEPPRDAKDSGSARSHSTHLETSSPNRP